MSFLGLLMAHSVSRLGQGQAREAGTESSGVSGISLFRAETSISQFASPRHDTLSDLPEE